MSFWSSASGFRLFMAVIAAVAMSCSSTVDHLGYKHQDAGTGDTGRVTTVLGRIACPATYPNAYRDLLGKKEREIDDHIRIGFDKLFHGADDSEAIYFDSGSDQAEIRDILHKNEVRSEGIGLGMMVAAMRDQRTEFNRLWHYALANLEYKSGPLQGYYRSRCDTSATSTEADSRECADPYGFQQLVMALLLARERWVVTSTTLDYGAEVLRLFDVMRNKEHDQGLSRTGAAGTIGSSLSGTTNSPGGAVGTGSGGTNGTAAATSTVGTADNLGVAGSSTNVAGSINLPNTAASGASGASDNEAATNLFDDVSRLVYFEPTSKTSRMTGTAFEMPGYYAVWAQVTGDAFYADAATKARQFLADVADAKTGLVPVRATFDATPVEGWADFTAEAYRVLLNLAIDRIWGGSDSQQNRQIEALLSFFSDQGIDSYGSAYSLDGKSVFVEDHRPELVLVNGVIAALSNLSEDEKTPFVAAAWNVPVPTGLTRYYPGILYLMSNLILGGQFRLCP